MRRFHSTSVEVTRPAHVNINVVQMMPVTQAFAPLAQTQ
jgi:hypothetical protein